MPQIRIIQIILFISVFILLLFWFHLFAFLPYNVISDNTLGVPLKAVSASYLNQRVGLVKVGESGYIKAISPSAPLLANSKSLIPTGTSIVCCEIYSHSPVSSFKKYILYLLTLPPW